LQLALHLLAMAGLLPNGTLPAVDHLVAMVLCGGGSRTWRPLRPFVFRIEFGKAAHSIGNLRALK
jgi:hypothetical protein